MDRLLPHVCDDGDGVTLYCGDAASVLARLPEDSVQTCITSPPYYGLRDYGTTGQIGHESTPASYVAALVAVFAAVRRVLKPDGTAWLNIGDSYLSAKGMAGGSRKNAAGSAIPDRKNLARRFGIRPLDKPIAGLKPKDLIGIPWRVALALLDDGWWLRSDVIWEKPNAMCDSVSDRPTRSHEYLFLLAKNRRYYYDNDAIREPCVTDDDPRNRADYVAKRQRNFGGQTDAYTRTSGAASWPAGGRNKRSVWRVPASARKGAHTAVFPPKLIEPCVLAGSRPGDTVLDPFVGSGTTALVARQYGRQCVGIDLNRDYLDGAIARLAAGK